MTLNHPPSPADSPSQMSRLARLTQRLLARPGRLLLALTLFSLLCLPLLRRLNLQGDLIDMLPRSSQAAQTFARFTRDLGAGQELIVLVTAGSAADRERLPSFAEDYAAALRQHPDAPVWRTRGAGKTAARRAIAIVADQRRIEEGVVCRQQLIQAAAIGQHNLIDESLGLFDQRVSDVEIVGHIRTRDRCGALIAKPGSEQLPHDFLPAWSCDQGLGFAQQRSRTCKLAAIGLIQQGHRRRRARKGVGQLARQLVLRERIAIALRSP